MWSHYANRHKGFVVELRIPLDAPAEVLRSIFPLEVGYASERPIVDMGCARDTGVEKYLLTKSTDWGYEQEERVISSGRKAGIYPHSREYFLCSVIAGAKMTDSDYGILRQAIDKVSREIGKTIPLRRACLASHKYKVYVPGHPSSTIGNE